MPIPGMVISIRDRKRKDSKSSFDALEKRVAVFKASASGAMQRALEEQKLLRKVFCDLKKDEKAPKNTLG